MERVFLEWERLVAAMRLEAGGVALGGAERRDLQVSMLSLRVALANGSRRRYAALASTLDLIGHPGLHDLALRWGTDDEFHERTSEALLWQLGAEPIETPLDAKLWDAYLDAIVVEQPWVTLGAMAAWEGLSAAAIELARTAAASGRILSINPSDQSSRVADLSAALRVEPLDQEAWRQLAEGASAAGVMGLRMVRWALGREEAEPGVRAWRTMRRAAGQF